MDVFIYHLYDWSIREAAAFRDTNGLGNLQIFTDDCNIAADFNWYGGRRLALYRIPDSDCDWDYHTALKVRIEVFIEGWMPFLSRGFGRKVFLLNCICGILTDKYVIMKKRRGSAVHEKQSEDFH